MTSVAGRASPISSRRLPTARATRSTLAGDAAPARFEQEPGPPLGLVDPVLEQARARHVVVLVAESVRLAHVRGELLVVLTQLCQHVERRDIVGIVVQDTLQAADLADRAQGRAADLAHAFGNVRRLWRRSARPARRAGGGSRGSAAPTRASGSSSSSRTT